MIGTNMKPLTHEQATCLTVMTGCICMDPAVFRGRVEQKLGRVVNVSEFNNPTFIETLQELYRLDFQELCRTVDEPKILMV